MLAVVEDFLQELEGKKIAAVGAFFPRSLLKRKLHKNCTFTFLHFPCRVTSSPVRAPQVGKASIAGSSAGWNKALKSMCKNVGGFCLFVFIRGGSFDQKRFTCQI